MSKWLPGARVIKATQDGGSMLGGHPRVVWHTTENDPHTTSAVEIANFLNREGYQVHLVWNPETGEIVQMIPANRAGRGLQNLAGGTETNRQGTVCIQIEVVGRATSPFTNDPCVGLDKIVRWLRKHNIQDKWPAGKSIAYPASYGDNGHRTLKAWLAGGHYGHENVPENVHGDAGKINEKKILAAGQTPSPTPAPIGQKTLVSNKKTGLLQKAVRITQTSKWGSSTEKALEAVRHGYPTKNVEYLQRRVGTKTDGVWGRASKDAYLKTVMNIQNVLGVVADGDWGTKTDDAYQALRKKCYRVYVDR